MTRKRDLKKRIRDRQARTGESYTTARRHVLAAREPGDDGDDPADDVDDIEATNPGIAVPKPDGDAIEVIERTSGAVADQFGQELAMSTSNPPRRSIEVDEVIDITDIGKELGLHCKVLMYERLARSVEPKLAVVAIRDALAATENDPATELLRAVASGQKPPMFGPRHVRGDRDFIERVNAGLSAVSSDRRILALHVNGFAGMVTVFCAAWRHNQTLILTTPEDRIGPALARVVPIVPIVRDQSLYLIYEGRRYAMTKEPFVVGRHPSCNLQIKDGYVSRKHAAIVQRHGVYYILDLGSHAGLEYKGMKISNKRIDEGDMFMVHEYALRFTFHETDA